LGATFTADAPDFTMAASPATVGVVAFTAGAAGVTRAVPGRLGLTVMRAVSLGGAVLIAVVPDLDCGTAAIGALGLSGETGAAAPGLTGETGMTGLTGETATGTAPGTAGLTATGVTGGVAGLMAATAAAPAAAPTTAAAATGRTGFGATTGIGVAGLAVEETTVVLAGVRRGGATVGLGGSEEDESGAAGGFMDNGVGTRGGGATDVVFFSGVSGSGSSTDVDDDGTPGVAGWLDRIVAGRIGMAGAASIRRVPGGGGAGMDAVFFAAVGRTKGLATVTASGLRMGGADSDFSGNGAAGTSATAGISGAAGFTSGLFSRKDSSASFATMGAAMIGAATSAIFSAMGVGFGGSTTGTMAAGIGGGTEGTAGFGTAGTGSKLETSAGLGTTMGVGTGTAAAMGDDLAFGGGGRSPGATIRPVRDFGGGSGMAEAGVTATGTGGGVVPIGPDSIFGDGKGGAESEEVLRSGGGVSIPVLAFACESGETPGRRPLPVFVRTFAGGGGTLARRPVRILGGTVGTDEVFGVGGATWASAAGVGVGVGGRSTRRKEPVGRFTCTGTGIPSGVVGRPGEPITPLLGAMVETGSVGFFAEEAPNGARGGMTVSGGCGATASGTAMAPACIGSGGVIGVGGLAKALGIGGGVTGTGGGVASTGGLARTTGAGGIGVEGVTVGSVCVAGSAGGRALWEIGSSNSPSSTLPLCTKTFALGFATTTRGGAVILPEGDVAGAPVSGGAAGAAVPLLAPRTWEGAASGLRCGKSGVVFAAGGAPVSGGAAGLWGGSAVGAGAMEPDGGRETVLIGLVTAVDHAGGTLEIGAGVIPGERIAAGFIGRVVAAEIFGRGAGMVVEAGLSGRGGNAMRRVSRFGGFCSGFSDSGGLPASAMVVVFIGISVNVQWRSW
jgi:collagen type I alpha